MKNSQNSISYTNTLKASVMISDAKDLAIGLQTNRVYFSVYFVDGIGIQVQNQFHILLRYKIIFIVNAIAINDLRDCNVFRVWLVFGQSIKKVL